MYEKQYHRKIEMKYQCERNIEEAKTKKIENIKQDAEKKVVIQKIIEK